MSDEKPCLGCDELRRLLSHWVVAAQNAQAEVRRFRSQVRLSGQELRILDKFRVKISYKEIASAMGISVDTVRTHVRRMYAKLGAHSAAEAINIHDQIQKDQQD